MKHMKRMKKKSLLLVAGIVLMLTIAIGGTIAYIVTNTQPVVNTFTPGGVPIEINEKFDGTTKSDVTIKNKGNVPAYIRAEIIVTWKNADGDVYWKKPVLGTDYNLSLNQGLNVGQWDLQSDDYYYYRGIVEARASTNPLIISCTRTDSTPPDGYSLSVEIIAESIQAEGMGISGDYNAYSAFSKAYQNQ